MHAWKALMSMGGRSDMKPTVSDRMAPRPEGSMIWRIVGSNVSNSLHIAQLNHDGDAKKHSCIAPDSVIEVSEESIRPGALVGMTERPSPMESPPRKGTQLENSLARLRRVPCSSICQSVCSLSSSS